MLYQILILLLLSIQSTTASQVSNNIITFFIYPYPVERFEIMKNPLAKITKLINKPSKLVRAQAPQINDGIIATYYGFVTISSLNGQITLPFKGQKPEFTLLITPFIKPIVMIGNTIHHWEWFDEYPKAFYRITREYDEKNGKYYWNVQKIATPSSKLISLNTITVWAKPDSIIVPLGKSPATDNPQLILPSLYAKEAINRINPALSLLKVRQFFGPVYFEIKKLSDIDYAQHIISSPSKQ